MRQHCLIISLLTLVVVATFWRTLYSQSVNYDDNQYVFSIPQVLQGISAEHVAWAFTTDQAGNYHPLTWLSLMLDSTILGAQPRSYHLTNLILHALTVALLYAALCAMTGAPWRSALVALLFGVHPLRVESVAWISERKDVLSGCLAMATLAAYALYARRPNWRRYVGVLSLFILGLLAKPMLVTLPCLLLLLDIWPLRRLAGLALPAPSPHGPDCPTRGAGWLVLEKVPLLLVSLAASIVTYFVQLKSGTMRDLHELPLSLRLANIPVSYVRYMVKMVWFRGLIVGYPFPDWPVWLVGGAIVLLLIITVIVCLRFRPNPWLTMGWFWFLGMLTPVIGIVQVGPQSLADRYSYLPTIGLLIMLVWSLPERLFQTRPGRLAIGATTLVMVVTLSVFTWQQVGYWHDSVALFSHAVEFSPQDELLLESLSAAYDAEQNRPDLALNYYRQAVRFNPRSAAAQFNLGSMLERMGQPNEAWVHLLEARNCQPDGAIAHHIQGVIDKNQKQYDLAIDQFQRSIAIDHTFIPPRLNLGLLLLMGNRAAEALAQFKEALRLDPHNAEVNVGMAAALANLGRFQEAVPYLRQAIQVQPGSARNYIFLGQLLIQLHRTDEAIANMQKAVELDPGNPGYRALLAHAQAARNHSNQPPQTSISQP